jgi:hypothetical protein
MPSINKSRDELPWLYYPKGNKLRVINSHLGAPAGFGPEDAWGLFDGSNDYVTIPGLQSAFSPSGDLTVTVVFRQSNAASGIEHIVCWSDGTNHFTMGLSASNIGIRMRSGGTNYDRVNSWTADSNVHVLQMTWDASPAGLLAWVDGSAIGTTGTIPVSPTLSANYVIGSRQNFSGNNFDGSVFYMSVNSKILSSDELLFERSGGVSGTDPVTYMGRYLFADDTGTTLADSSGNSRNGTATNITQATFWNP